MPDIPGETKDEYASKFFEAMDDDFNTVEAIAVLFDLAHAVNRARTEQSPAAARLAQSLRALSSTLGLLQRDADEFLQGGSTSGAIAEREIEKMIAQRTDARLRRDWAESDRIRDELKAQGVILEDTGGQTSWRRV